MCSSLGLQALGETDILSFTRADLYRQALQRLTPDQKNNREALYQKSFALLADAETKNTYRPKIYAIRGLLISENPDLAGKDWQNKASKAFRNALKVNPRFLEGRMDYVTFLKKTGKIKLMNHLLEAGMPYPYYKNPYTKYLYAMVAQEREKRGDTEGAEEAEALLKKLNTQ